MRIAHKAPTKSEGRRGPGLSGGGRPGQRLSRDLTRAPVFFAAIALLCSASACIGPGLEPPKDQNASAGHSGGVGGAGGVGGMSGVGGTGGFGLGGTGGLDNPGGVGGSAGMASPTGGAGGVAAGGAGGEAGTAGGLGGMGGAGGMSGMGDPDAGMDPGAPLEACELERDVVMIEAQEGTTGCQITVPADEAYGPEQITLAITDEQGTTLVPQIPTTIACPETIEGFAYSPAFVGATIIELCEASCALAEGAVVELIYGCEPPTIEL